MYWSYNRNIRVPISSAGPEVSSKERKSKSWLYNQVRPPPSGGLVKPPYTIHRLRVVLMEIYWMNLSIFMEKKKRRSVFQQVFQGWRTKAHRRRRHLGVAAWRQTVRRRQRRYCNNYYLSTAALKMDWQIQGLPNNWIVLRKFLALCRCGRRRQV